MDKKDFSIVDIGQVNDCIAVAKAAHAYKNTKYAHDVLQAHDADDTTDWINDLSPATFSYGDNVRQQLETQIRGEIEAQLRRDIERELRASIEKELRTTIENEVRAQLRQEAARQVQSSSRPQQNEPQAQPSLMQVKKWSAQGKEAFDARRYVDAFSLFEKAAAYGDDTAQNWLGYCFYHGCGTSVDYGRAVKWFTAAAKAGNANAQDWLGHCYECGHGVSRDKEKAKQWYKSAAAKGIVHAKDALSRLTYQG